MLVEHEFKKPYYGCFDDELHWLCMHESQYRSSQ